MQTPSIPSLTNLGASPLATKASDSNSDQHFGQMLERQISQREAAKPVESPKPPAQRQDAKAPSTNSATSNNTNNNTNNTNNANSATAAASTDKQDDAATATTAITDTSTTTSIKADAAVKKEGKTADTKTVGDETYLTTPADATLAASAAIMALVANAGSNPGKPVVQVDAKASTDTLDAARSAGNAAAVDLAAKAGARDSITAATVDAAVAQAAKAGADGFGTALQTAGAGSARETVALMPADIARASNNDLAQITPQLQQTAFEVAPPTGIHPGDILAPRIGNDNCTLGARTIARPIATRWRWPPESSLGVRCR